MVGGAQDNCVQIGRLDNAGKPSRALGVVFGDGMGTAIDGVSVGKPRFFGSSQFLGQGVEDDDRNTGAADLGGFGFVEGDPADPDAKNVAIRLERFFPGAEAFPYFYQVFRLNGGGEPTAKQRLAMWVQGNGTRPSGFWEFVLDDRVASEADVPAPRLLGETDGGVYDFAFGSMYDGELLVGLNSTHLLVRDGAAALAPKPLPTAFADPVVLTYKDGEQVL